MNKEDVLLIRDKAYRFIQADKKGLWKLWHEAKTEYDRELIMTHVVFEQTWEKAYDEGYDAGYDNGRRDGDLYGGDEG